MDPIHPIVPASVNVEPVTAAPLISAVDRDKRRQKSAEQERRRHEDRSRREDPELLRGDDADDGGPHIDITA